MEDFISNQFEILDNIKKNNMPVDPVIMDDTVDGRKVSKEDLDQSLLSRLKKKKVISQSPVAYGKEMTSALQSDEEDDVQIKRRVRNSKPVITSPREKDDTQFKTPSKPVGRQKAKRSCPLNISSEEESEIGKILGDDVKMDDSDEDFAVDSFKTKIKFTENKDFKKKRKKVKCAFIEEEAELSGEDNSSDESTGSDLGQLSGNFINDETVYSSQAHLHDSVDNQAMYLRSMRSPVQLGGKFRLQYNHKYQDVFSQVPHQDEEPSQYMEDSFCVDNDYEDSFIASEDEDSLLVVKKRDKPKKKKTKGSNIVKGKKRLCKFSDTSSDDDMKPAIPLTQNVMPLSKSPDGCKKPSRKVFFSSSEDDEPTRNRLGLNKDCDGSSREQNSVLSAMDSRNLNQNVESNSMLTITNHRKTDQSSELKSILTRKSNQNVESNSVLSTTNSTNLNQNIKSKPVLTTLKSKNSNKKLESNSDLTAMNFRKSNPSIQSESVLNTIYSGNSNKFIESSNSLLTTTKSRNTDQNVQSISKPENQTIETSENEVPIPTNSLQLPNFELDLDFFDNDFMDDSEQSVKTDTVLKTSTTKSDQIDEKISNEEKLRTERLQKQKEQKEKFKTCLVGSSNTGDVSKHGVNASTSATATDINMEEVLTERQVIKKSNRLTLVVDTREISGAQDIISNLRFHHEINVEVRQLKTCDYVLSTRLAVDRQLWSEFSNGSNHSKLVERLQKMRGLYERCCLVVERDKTKPGAQKNKRQRSKYVDQTIATLSQSDIRILFTDSQAETVDILVELCQLENKKGLGITVPLHLNNNQEQVLKFYLSIPKVTYIQAVQFVHKFKNISHFLNSSAKVIEIQGKLTSQRAGEIYNYINHKFDLQMVPSSR